MPAISETISRFIDNLEESGKDSESKLMKILANEYRLILLQRGEKR